MDVARSGAVRSPLELSCPRRGLKRGVVAERGKRIGTEHVHSDDVGSSAGLSCSASARTISLWPLRPRAIRIRSTRWFVGSGGTMNRGTVVSFASASET